ncbi:MAG: single-stranded DNA-binding protein [Dehalococcoidia bacterium]
MAYLNRIMVIGNIGSDPEMRFTPNGRPLTSFRLATNRFFTTSDGERKRETEWFDVITQDRQAESCNQFLTKGQRVYAEGRLRTRTWEGQDGQNRFRLEIRANRVIFLDRKGTNASEEEHGAPTGEEMIDAEELPFSSESE